MKVSRDDIERAIDTAIEEGQLEWKEEELKNINNKYDKERYNKRQSRRERNRRAATRDDDYTESNV